MKKSIKLILFVLSFTSMYVSAQVAKTSIVEHFTNTSCSICASNNPSIHSTLQANPSVLHISFHPSAPYITDVFSQSNKIENDARTNFYAVYGGTPRTVLNGVSIAYNTLGTALPPLATEMSNFQVTVKQIRIGSDSFEVETTLKKVAADTSKTALLFLGAIEDTVFQTTNNGEKFHYNVFRKALSNINGLSITLPITVGDSLVFKQGFKANSSWQLNRIHTLAILQHLNKTVITSSKSANKVDIVNGFAELDKTRISRIVSPNPSTGILFANEASQTLTIYDSYGKAVLEFTHVKPLQPLDVSSLSKGIYMFISKDLNLLQTQKVVLQ